MACGRAGGGLGYISKGLSDLQGAAVLQHRRSNNLTVGSETSGRKAQSPPRHRHLTTRPQAPPASFSAASKDGRGRAASKDGRHNE